MVLWPSSTHGLQFLPNKENSRYAANYPRMNPMRLLLPSAALFLALSIPAAAAPLALYISPSGSDAAVGSQKSPLATLDGAKSRLQTLKKTRRLFPEGITVWLRGGTYPLEQTFTLSAADLPNTPVTFQAFPNESVRMIGGAEVKSWHPVTEPSVLSRLDLAARRHVQEADLKAQGITDYGQLTPRGFGRPTTPADLELFFHEAPMTLARWPNLGTWAAIAGTPAGQNGGLFAYSGDRPSRWAKDEDIWIHGYWTFDWADSYEKIQSIDTTKHEIATVAPHGPFGYTTGHHWYALNILEELDAPGEWYLDRKLGKLYFWPPSDVKKGHPMVSLLSDLVHLDHVSRVTLRGLTLEVCRGQGVIVDGGDHNLVIGCKIQNTGNQGAIVAGGTNNGVQNCDITETGDGSVSLSGGDRKTLTPGRNFALNCRIWRYSRWDRTYRPGVSIDGVGNHIAHCLIYDAPHNAILLSGNDHLIEYNEIHHVCRETGDAGAFYMGRDWTMRGNVVRYNYFHDIGGSTGVKGEFHDAMAIYLDDTAAGTTVFGNVCVRAGHAVMVGGGRDDIVANNIFVDCHPAVSLDGRGLSWAAKSLLPGGDWGMQERLAAVAYNQPPYSTRYPHLANVLSDNPAAPKYDVIQHNITVRCPNWLEIQDKADTLPGITIQDNLTDKDPLFVDAAHGNYQLKANSPAYALGFQRIPFEKIGWKPAP